MNPSEATGILDQVTKNTNSELILFFVILAVVLVVMVIPLYTLLLKDRKHKNELENTRQETYIKRESRIIEVITANTEIMAGLKATLDANGVSTSSSFARMHDRMDSYNIKINDLSTEMAQIKVVLDRTISNQKEMAEGIDRILLTVNNLPYISSFQGNKEGLGDD